VACKKPVPQIPAFFFTFTFMGKEYMVTAGPNIAQCLDSLVGPGNPRSFLMYLIEVTIRLRKFCIDVGQFEQDWDFAC